MSIQIPRESIEYLTLDVLVDGETPSTGVQVSIRGYGVRPLVGDWIPATLVDGRWVTLVQGLQPGVYDVWVRVSLNPEQIVEYVREAIKIT